MARYRLSHKQIRGVLKALLAKGQLTQDEFERRKDYFFKRVRRLAIIAMFSDDDLMTRLVLKGGNALDIAYSVEFRSSIDLDFSMEGQFSDDEIVAIRAKIDKCLKETFRPEGYQVFDVTFREKPPAVSPDMADFWGGYRVEFKIIRPTRYGERGRDITALRRFAEPVDTSSRKNFRIEISKFENCVRKREMGLDHYTIYVYSPEQIVVEKIRSICQQMPAYGQIVKSKSQSPRPKDFLDILVTIKNFGIDLTSRDNVELLRCSFESKRVPLTLIERIRDFREYHRQGFEAVRDTVYRGVDLKDFDFYFDYVVSECEKLESLWDK